MVRMRLVETAMDVLYKPECCIIRLLVMLLVNLTQLDSGTASLLQVCYYSFIYIYCEYYIHLRKTKKESNSKAVKTSINVMISSC